jgi:pimeloyl-ACP methyl ester carboxylesterase
MKPLLIAVTMLGLSGPIGAPEDPPPAVGHWVGPLKIGPAALSMVLHVEQQDDGGLRASLDSPDQGGFGLEVASISLDGRTLRFEAPKLDARFEGAISGDGQTLAGTFTQRGSDFPLMMTRTAEEDLPRPVDPPAVLQGIWEGPIELPLGQELRVAIRVEPDPNRPGARTIVFDSLDQDAKGIPVTAVEVDGQAVRFEVKSIGGAFKGSFDEEKSKISGTWSQSIMNLPLTLAKVEELSERNRPQEPKPPFPYEVEELTFENPEAGITLAGTLTLPEGDGPFPAAVMVSGSGPQDRDETLLGHKPFLVIADHLARSGIAVLRFDDRGVGESGGEFASATSEDFASDALAAVRFLHARPEVDGEAVGIIGHSEGGLVGPMAATRAPGEVDFLVLLAGTAVNGKEIILRQTDLIVRASGASETAAKVQIGSLEALIGLVESGRIDEVEPEELDTLLDDALEALAPEEREALEETDGGLSEVASQAGDQFKSPWFRFFLSYDPGPTLERVECPVLALFGEKDLQVDPKQNAPVVEEALRKGGNDRSSVEVLPGLNHLFQHSESGSPLEYGGIEETIAPEALDRIAGWIRGTTGRD